MGKLPPNQVLPSRAECSLGPSSILLTAVTAVEGLHGDQGIQADSLRQRSHLRQPELLLKVLKSARIFI